ncbi:MAG: MFS transporter, partial [Treponema sp.]|jgi:fucose permease|nr:MFS transporter [Treponema sp.]
MFSAARWFTRFMFVTSIEEMSVSKKTRILLIVLINATMFLFGFLENIKGVSYPLIKTEFGVSHDEQGRMVSLLSFSYTFFCIAAGYILSRFGLKKVYLMGFIFALLGLSLVFFAPGFWISAACLFLVFSCFGLFEIGVNGLASILFTKKAALSLNLLHFMYGVGAVLGPRAAGMICGIEGLSWRHVYLFSVPLVLLFFIPAAAATYPEPERENSLPGTGPENGSVRRGGSGFSAALRTPLVWFFGIVLGLMMSVEMATSNWGSLYFQDVYGMDPTTAGAGFVSGFFVLFTLSRLVSGFVIEKIGYIKSLTGAVVIIGTIFLAGFALGRMGIYVLPVLGFFIAILWPTLMAAAMGVFGAGAPVMCSAVIAIGGLFNALMQLATGYVNRYVGDAWGYRSCLIFVAALLALLLKFGGKLKKPEAMNR